MGKEEVSREELSKEERRALKEQKKALKEEKKLKKEAKRAEKALELQKKLESKEDDGASKDDIISVDLNEPAPLSKKEKRLLKKGKIEKIPKKKLESTAVKAEAPASEDDANNGETASKPKKLVYSVWIGNLSFETSEEELKTFLSVKAEQLYEEDKDKYSEIEESDIVRVKLPKQKDNPKRNKGFAYVDFPTEKQRDTAIAISEMNLNGRNLLIKNGDNFEGRPAVSKAQQISFGEPSRILFVGNLSFETLEEDLEKHFRHCGEIFRIRMATFQDSGKCKGFAFVDFKDIESATKALHDKLCAKLMGRSLKLQYGEDRSKKRPMKDFSDRPPPKRAAPQERERGGRVKSSVALAKAQRGSAAIVESKGKKVTFD